MRSGLSSGTRLSPARQPALPARGAADPAGSCSGVRRASLPQPGSPAVPGEGAQEPDPRSQGRPHRARPAGIRSGEGGRRRARSRRVSLAGSRPGLNAPRPGPPRLGGQTPGAPAPLHLQALGVGPGANRPANVRHLHVLGLGLPVRHRRPSQLLGAPPALHFLPLPAWVPKAASADESARGDLPSAPQLVPAAPFCPSRSGS